MSYVPFKSDCGPNWEDLDDNDLNIFITGNEISESSMVFAATNKNGPDDDDDDDEEAEQIARETDNDGEEPIFCLKLAKMKYINGVWGSCNARPAYEELSYMGSYQYPHERVQYHANWRDLKESSGADMRLPMLIKSSPLRSSLTWKHDDEGGYIIEEDGKRVPEPLLPSAESEPALDNGSSEEEKEQDKISTPPRSPPCVPGSRGDREFEKVC